MITITWKCDKCDISFTKEITEKDDDWDIIYPPEDSHLHFCSEDGMGRMCLCDKHYQEWEDKFKGGIWIA